MDKVIREVQSYKKSEYMRVMAYADDVMVRVETEDNLDRELVK